jgi:hypothetical protein
MLRRRFWPSVNASLCTAKQFAEAFAKQSKKPHYDGAFFGLEFMGGVNV